ncbi:hypothetical protein [Sphaerisporangium dianthi]|uniref:Uncharacterized protein n=1 Tax=Sphaerisporangium dianthi TaxID=1436120 RepID=A0ABV9C999_9ACTN
MYGRDDETWDRLTEAGLEFLIECARQSRPTSYTELNAQLERRTGIDGFDFGRQDERAAMGYLLGLIVDRNRPETGMMISALVTYTGGTGAGAGFFNLAADLALIPRRASAEQKDEFWVRQMKGVYAYYSAARES